MGTLRYFAAIVFASACVAVAQTTTYGPGDQATIEAWDVSGSSDGDIYIMEPGTWTWTVADRFSVGNRKIFGSGIDVTYIEYSPSSDGNRQIISLYGDSRLSNLTIKDDSAPSGDGGFGGAVKIGYNADPVSIDNIKFTSTSGSGYRAIYAEQHPDYTPRAVIWNCTFNNRGYACYPRNGRGDYGDYQWGVAPPFGSQGTLVFEDNVLGANASFDGDSGATYTVRFNEFTDAYVHGHGVTSGRYRGTRLVEVYENDMEWVTINNRIAAVELRSGTGIVFNNRITPHSGTGEPDNFVNISNYRVGWNVTPWYYADGKNFWDVAYTDDGAGTPGGAGDGVYETGTITSVEGDKDFTDSSKSGVWADDEWNGYTLRILGPQAITASAGSGLHTIVVSPDPGWSLDEWNGYAIRNLTTGQMQVISDTTSDTITTSSSTSDTLPNLTASEGDTFDVFLSNALADTTSSGSITTLTAGTGTGDNNWPDITGRSYELRKLRRVIDGIAVGIANTTNLGGFAISPPTSPAFSQPVAAYPWYEWGNTSTGTVGSRIARGIMSAFTIASDIEYFDYEASFDGTAGVGVGTKAEMNAITPTTTNVGFWVTDEADWDKTDVGVADGQLYQWNGSAWVLYYTPLEYPHPVRATLDPLPSVSGAAYSGRLRFNGTGAKPVRTDGVGQPIIFDQ